MEEGRPSASTMGTTTLAEAESETLHARRDAVFRERLEAVLDHLLGRKPPPIVEETKVSYRSREPVSPYGCLDDGEDREYPPADSVVKFLRMR